MTYRVIIRVLGSFLFLYALILLIPLAVAAYYQFIVHPIDHPQPHATVAFVLTIAVCLCLAIPCYFISWRAKGVLYQRESLASSVFIWVLTPAIGALPFIFSGTLERFDQAYLEVSSAFTTTGLSVLEPKKYDPQTGSEILIKKTIVGLKENTYEFFGNIKPVVNRYTKQKLEGIEAVSRAILFWRSFAGWLGGMGIILLFVAFLPALGTGGKFLFQTETPGIEKEGFAPRIKEIAFKLWKIYAGMTILLIFLLLFTNRQMTVLDAVTIAFSTVATGGLTIHPDSIAFYNNVHTEWIVCLFMIAAGVNLSLYHYVLKGKIYRLFEPEFILYLAIILFLGLFAAWTLIGEPRIAIAGNEEGVYSVSEAIGAGFFQLISALTSTGFYTVNYEAWPMSLQALLLFAMFVGAMAGSTSGGLKLIRLLILFKVAKKKIEAIFRPKVVKILRVGTKEIDTNTALTVLCFFFVSILFCALGTFVYVYENIDAETSLGLSISMLNTTGLGFRLNGPTGSLAFMSPFLSYFSSFLMILGRLEFFAVLVLLFPSFWRENG